MDINKILNLPFEAVYDGITYIVIAIWVLIGVHKGAYREPWWLIIVGPLFFLVFVGAFDPVMGFKLYVLLVLTFGMGYGLGRFYANKEDDAVTLVKKEASRAIDKLQRAHAGLPLPNDNKPADK